MEIYRISNDTETIYILLIGKFSIGFNNKNFRISIAFNGKYSIGFDHWLQEGYKIQYKTILGRQT